MVNPHLAFSTALAAIAMGIFALVRSTTPKALLVSTVGIALGVLTAVVWVLAVYLSGNAGAGNPL
ncbi:MAG: hypothetical protein K2Y37_16420 [Pirellulales bacterium]|nr:hypothetical protein [Pirellulales bacterium]